MIYALHLYGRPSQGEAHRADLTRLAPDWRRSIHRIKGYLTGSFSISSERLGRTALEELYHSIIGCTVRETSYGLVTWEGLVIDARLVAGGAESLRSLDPERWHNKVKALFSTDVAERTVIGWTENADSEADYGTMEYILPNPGSTSAAATAKVARHLAELAWPRSWEQGKAQENKGATLSVTVAGYWATLNWRYRETAITDQADTLMTALAAASEWVTAGRIETNTLSVRLDCYPNPQRLGDLAESILGQGDAAGNLWQGGVYAGKQLVYEPAPTTVTHQLRNGVLLDATGQPVIPTLALPGVLARRANAPIGWPTHGVASTWDDPRVSYIEEVEFQAPSTLAYRLYGQEESVALLDAQMQRQP